MNDTGRKMSLAIFSIVGLVGWLLLACGTEPTYIYFGRVLSGTVKILFGFFSSLFWEKISMKVNGFMQAYQLEVIHLLCQST